MFYLVVINSSPTDIRMGCAYFDTYETLEDAKKAKNKMPAPEHYKIWKVEECD